MNAAVARSLVSSPRAVSRNTATIGKKRLRNWFQRLTSVIPRVISRRGRPQLWSIPNETPSPAAVPAGRTSESAVEACVSSIAWKNRSFGSTTSHGGA